MMGITSSATATMRSPNVVLITFRCRMFFSSTHSPNDLISALSRLVTVGREQAACPSQSKTAKHLYSYPNQHFMIWRGRDRYEEHMPNYRHVSKCRLHLGRAMSLEKPRMSRFSSNAWKMTGWKFAIDIQNRRHRCEGISPVSEA